MGNFTDKDMGWYKMMSRFTVNAGETAGFVGWLRSSGEHKSKESGGKAESITVAQIAAIQEWGNDHIPERAPVRTALSEHAKDIKKLLKKVTNKVLDGKLDKKQAIGVVCQKIADGIVAKIESNLPPPNAESTIARKGSSTTLIDSAQMKNSVDWEIMGGEK